MQFLIKIRPPGNTSASFIYQWMKIVEGVEARYWPELVQCSFLMLPAVSITDKKDFGNQVSVPKQAELPYFTAHAL